ncbi:MULTISPECIES: hemerythrin domain-containing protein [unclassified Streptomyces]|uniref:hemerythrin domain-containing protein n=1 Tax=unclassified Streptomyces TaxID=2593676 RepID=UPI0027E36369|nr:MULTISPECIES: hemerythrin domain-containing protein [unclassified Streptomyces]
MTTVTAVQLREVVEQLVAAGRWKPGNLNVLILLNAGYETPRTARRLRQTRRHRIEGGRPCTRRTLRSRVTERETTRLVAWSQELRRVHRRLREALSVTRTALADGSPGEEATRELLLYCHGFCTALGSHHQGEDRTLFPAIAAAHPQLRPVLRALEQDHSNRRPAGQPACRGRAGCGATGA